MSTPITTHTHPASTVPATGNPHGPGGPRRRRGTLLTLVASLVLSLAGFVGLGVAAAPSADAASCFRTVTVSGANAFGYARAYSWEDYSAYVRTAPVATLCINYARAYGGYYIASVTCNQSSARLTSDSTSFRRGGNSVIAAYHTYAACDARATWLWNRTVANDQCVSISSRTRWDINQTNGSVRVGTSVPSSGYFVPASSC